MKITADSPPVLTALDRPNSYIGRSVPRPNLQRLTQGRGLYVSDVTLPRMAHVAFGDYTNGTFGYLDKAGSYLWEPSN
jgi:carbon-monoxide dehydrogenase large subunit